MGFCLFNNIAVAAAHALAAHGLKRVAIADFDVHHGNGTQDIFAAEPRVLFISSHQSPLYPETGREDERGVGNIVNAPLSPGDGSYEFRELWDGLLLPRLHAFKPQLVLVSAGFDAHHDDPLAELRLNSEDFAWITERLVALAHAHAGGRLVSSLEGGYNLRALAASASAHVTALLD
jgi:acetoin utilization deacetylase AcuC-like enzyme